MRQFFLDLRQDVPPALGTVVTLDAEESHHLQTVLRGGRGQTLVLTDGRGRRYTGAAVPGPGRQSGVEILSCTEDVQERRPPLLVLAVAVVKGKRFDWALEKAVETGAHRIVPLRTERGVIEPGAGRQQRWQALLRAALKQSGRTLLPQLDEPQDLTAALAALTGGPVWVAAAPDEGQTAADPPVAPDLPAGLAGSAPPFLAACVGPEGGWTEAELALLAARGARPLRLGPHVLRTETAAVAALVTLQRWRWRLGTAG